WLPLSSRQHAVAAAAEIWVLRFLRERQRRVIPAVARLRLLLQRRVIPAVARLRLLCQRRVIPAVARLRLLLQRRSPLRSRHPAVPLSTAAVVHSRQTLRFPAAPQPCNSHQAAFRCRQIRQPRSLSLTTIRVVTAIKSLFHR